MHSPVLGTLHTTTYHKRRGGTCSGATIHSLLEEYKDYPALAVNWIMFGSSGRQTRPPEGGMLRWYVQCRATPEPHIKVIVNSKQVQTVQSPHPHNIYYKCDLPVALSMCLQHRTKVVALPQLPQGTLGAPG